MSSVLTHPATGKTEACVPLAERYFGPLAAALLAIMAVALFSGVFLDSDTVDESYHLRAGYAFLKTGVSPRETEHPPLSQVISALPLLPLRLWLKPPAGSSTGGESRWSSDAAFLYQNRVSPEVILIAGRIPKVFLTLAFGAVIAWWTRRHFGPAAGLFALALFAFDPNIIAHGHLATTDLAAAFGLFAGCIAWNAFLERGDMGSALRCGLVTGLAVAVKYSALALPPLYFILYLAHGFQQAAANQAPPWRVSLGHLVKSMVVLSAGIFAALYTCYGFQTRPLLPPEVTETRFTDMLAANSVTAPLGRGLLRHPDLARSLDRAAVHTPIPIPSFFRGIVYISQHNARGHASYFLGLRSGTGGWWYYFPILLQIKSPTGLLLLLLLSYAAVFYVVLSTVPRNAIVTILRTRREWFVITIPPLLYFLVATTSRINIGIRHILPVYPFLFVWVAAAVFRSRGRFVPALLRWAGVIFLGLVAVESAAAFPRYISFFNWPNGGRTEGWKFVVDSNLDWGQDMKRLGDYLKQRKLAGNVCLATFSEAPPAHFGITAHPIPASAREARAQGCLVVASLSVLYEWAPLDGSYNWLLRRRPSERVADSFNVYSLTTGRD